MAEIITGVLYPSEIQAMTEEELQANTTFVVVDGLGKLKRVLRTAMYNNMANLGLRGEKGDKGDTGNTGPVGATGASGAVGATGAIGPRGPTGNTGATGPQGFNGWSPILALVARGADTVAQVIDWSGGTGTKPTVGLYISTTGLTPNIALATKLNGNTGATGGTGAAGANGTNGWSPLIRLEAYEGLRYFYLYDWSGGTGTKPTLTGFVTSTGIIAIPDTGSAVDNDYSSQINAVDLRVDDVNTRLIVVEENTGITVYKNVEYLSVKSTTVLTPPSPPVENNLYVVPINATGVWVGHVGQLAYFSSGSWNFVVPTVGYLVYSEANKIFYVFDGITWVDSQATVKTGLTSKVDKVDGKALSTNDFTTTLKDKLDGLTQTVIVDELTSTAIDQALSANQGKVLKDLYDALELRVQNLEAP